MSSSNPSTSELDQYDFDLPRELIAQEPLAQRVDSRMMVIYRATETIEHAHVRDLPDYLKSGDTLVVNDSKVIPARLIGRWTLTGGRWEGLFLRQDDSGVAELLCKTRGSMEVGETITINDLEGRDQGRLVFMGLGEQGRMLMRPESPEPWFTLLDRCGRVPLPPYIRDGQMVDDDKKRYQTVYARVAGSVAAPTAGLHFTPELIQRIRSAGMALVAVTLHVGIGTFRPIQVERLADHRMHSEYGEITGPVAKRLQTTRSEGGRIIAVGTTSVRVLETAAAHAKIQSQDLVIDEWSGETDIFIKPGYQFQAVDGLLTNFHLPKSSLIVLVSALAGQQLIKKAYQEAILEKYRFYSYGDCMLIL